MFRVSPNPRRTKLFFSVAVATHLSRKVALHFSRRQSARTSPDAPSPPIPDRSSGTSWTPRTCSCVMFNRELCCPPGGRRARTRRASESFAPPARLKRRVGSRGLGPRGVGDSTAPVPARRPSTSPPLHDATTPMSSRVVPSRFCFVSYPPGATCYQRLPTVPKALAVPKIILPPVGLAAPGCHAFFLRWRPDTPLPCPSPPYRSSHGVPLGGPRRGGDCLWLRAWR